MFSLFGRSHRHKSYEEALIILSEEISTIRMENVSIRAKFAVASREKQKIERVNTQKTLPQDVRDILAHYPGAKVESVFDSEGHAVYVPGDEKE